MYLQTVSGKLYLPNSQYRVLRLMWVAVTSYVDFFVEYSYNVRFDLLILYSYWKILPLNTHPHMMPHETQYSVLTIG